MTIQKNSRTGGNLASTQQKSDLPFGSEFSPSQVELPRLLELAHEHEGDQAALQAAIQAGYFSGHGGGSAKNQRTLAMNCRLGMRAYVLSCNRLFPSMRETGGLYAKAEWGRREL